MSTSQAHRLPALAVSVSFDEDAMHVTLSDGRAVSVPLEWLPRLRDASDEERDNWRLIGQGIGLHWPDLDQDISVEGLLKH